MLFKKDDTVRLKPECENIIWVEGELPIFTVRDILTEELTLKIVIGYDGYGKDWVEFVDETEIYKV